MLRSDRIYMFLPIFSLELRGNNQLVSLRDTYTGPFRKANTAGATRCRETYKYKA